MVFQCINIRQVPWEMLKTAAFGLGFQHLPRDLANVNAWKNMFDPYINISSSSLNTSHAIGLVERKLYTSVRSRAGIHGTKIFRRLKVLTFLATFVVLWCQRWNYKECILNMFLSLCPANYSQTEWNPELYFCGFYRCVQSGKSLTNLMGRIQFVSESPEEFIQNLILFL